MIIFDHIRWTIYIYTKDHKSSIHEFIHPLDAGILLPLGVPGESLSSAGPAKNRKKWESPATGNKVGQKWAKFWKSLDSIFNFRSSSLGTTWRNTWKNSLDRFSFNLYEICSPSEIVRLASIHTLSVTVKNISEVICVSRECHASQTWANFIVRRGMPRIEVLVFSLISCSVCTAYLNGSRASQNVTSEPPRSVDLRMDIHSRLLDSSTLDGGNPTPPVMYTYVHIDV